MPRLVWGEYAAADAEPQITGHREGEEPPKDKMGSLSVCTPRLSASQKSTSSEPMSSTSQYSDL